MCLAFNGMKMTDGYFNGKKVLGIYYNGNRIWPSEESNPGPIPIDNDAALNEYTEVLSKFKVPQYSPSLADDKFI